MAHGNLTSITTILSNFIIVALIYLVSAAPCVLQRVNHVTLVESRLTHMRAATKTSVAAYHRKCFHRYAYHKNETVPQSI